MLVSVRVFVCLLRERSALEGGEGIIVYSIYLRLRRPTSVCSAARSFSERGLVPRLFSCVWTFGTYWASCCFAGFLGGRAMHGKLELVQKERPK